MINHEEAETPGELRRQVATSAMVVTILHNLWVWVMVMEGRLHPPVGSAIVGTNLPSSWVTFQRWCMAFPWCRRNCFLWNLFNLEVTFFFFFSLLGFFYFELFMIILFPYVCSHGKFDWFNFLTTIFLKIWFIKRAFH